jgi:hypothetical protein
VGYKAFNCPTKKKNQTPAPATGSAGKSAQTPRTADRGQLTHLTGKETRDAPYAKTGKCILKKFKF